MPTPLRNLRARRSRAPTPSVGRAVLQFALTGMAAVALLGFVAVELLQRTGRREATATAKRETELAGRGIVAPEISPGLIRGDPAAIARMDALVRGRVLRAPVVRVKLWDSSGRIVYSDEHRLI